MHDFLNRCVLDNKRNVKELNHFKRFQSIPIYDTLLKIDDIKALSPEGRNQREKFRDDWFNRSLEKLSNCDVIFCDPDNGIETKSLSKTSKDSVKYIFSNEIIGMINRGYTLIIYNHRDRSKESDYKQRFKEIYQEINGKAKLRVLRFSRYNVRDYLFFIQKKHKNIIDTQINHLPEYRGIGLGSCLLKRAIGHAKSQNGIEKVELEVFESNENAVKFYQKHGFFQEGRRVKARKLNGQYDNIILMGKFI